MKIKIFAMAQLVRIAIFITIGQCEQSFEKIILHCHTVKKFFMVNKLTIVNTFVLHTLHHNITHSAIRTPKTTEKKNGKFEMWGGGGEESRTHSINKNELKLTRERRIRLATTLSHWSLGSRN